ncbi:hypothetical protein C4D60_Mb11t10170 [Musa balbisiana]|uniref:Uncharacterized protein n=1 Tax=Musa balbisiana TaxID=52838 RepID=A0A4S8J3Y9_MUSBA|nr:hypothetical protein C4D60_Mb11t10170 [Musa balbisiana]
MACSIVDATQGSDKSSDDFSDEATTIFVIDVITATTICIDANANVKPRKVDNNEIDDVLLMEMSGS